MENLIEFLQVSLLLINLNCGYKEGEVPVSMEIWNIFVIVKVMLTLRFVKLNSEVQKYLQIYIKNSTSYLKCMFNFSLAAYENGKPVEIPSL